MRKKLSSIREKRKLRRAQKHVARDISYASSAKSLTGQAFIRTMENVTGRRRMIRQAKGYELEVANGKNFWQVMVEKYGLRIKFLRGTLDNIPKSGPLIVVANHPYGILDGMVLGHILSSARGDFKILANQVFRNAPDINMSILPISFDETREAAKKNLETRRIALKYLSENGCIGIFPGGTVSTAATPMGEPMDPIWRNFTAKLIQQSGASVVPIYFGGSNSRLFQIASHTKMILRMALLIREFKKQKKGPIPLVIGEPISREEIEKRKGNPKELMDFLRKSTYELSPNPVDANKFGFEFEETYR